MRSPALNLRAGAPGSYQLQQVGDVDHAIAVEILGAAIVATTAIVAANRGFSRLLIHLGKTAGVDLAALHEYIERLGLEVVKVSSEGNASDLFTKCLLGPRIEYLCSILGVYSATARQE